MPPSDHAAPPAVADVLIVGQGIAGSTLYWRLEERGLETVVVDRGGVDRDGRPSASRVAAGLLTPLTGKRLTLSPEFDDLFAAARGFYRGVEARTGQDFFTEQAALRVFVDAAERRCFEHRHHDPAFARHVRLALPAELPAPLVAPHGAFWMRGAARLDTTAYLDATRRQLERDSRFFSESLDLAQDLSWETDAVYLPKIGLRARQLVLCQGYCAPLAAWPGAARFAPARGEVLTVACNAYRSAAVLHRGIWVAPCESGVAGRYRVGSTYDWHDLDAPPSAAARAELLARLAEAGLAEGRVIDQQAAVRPATPDRQPLWGIAPDQPRIAWLNGLGAKGSLLAPTYAARLADRLAKAF
ncbi:NAD(P)/FAD-dependent oxidoreductase [Botrimarina hoheduenensis]|uniref:Bifunctional tRNA (Mnm(5)s(2)U34)-methyltransferase/FAD-dependent cmnm(5)s(2)U34 oxidoreductase n=1 Tax=Botrimarina hoheduenensis TaxID=2528000 RepID=A0A5C5W7I0_9BACT|nr:FAD-binding oxidoreductase [Botrimarina hoheduenensis]TWT46640.1 bifunctional tRNA (mnm(5)s(2)U34)-methyltransferase/FAD-dependent cmnm(5)s(2)U34 oxidoreductase [Botrimarina hoheduenensis]